MQSESRFFDVLMCHSNGGMMLFIIKTSKYQFSIYQNTILYGPNDDTKIVKMLFLNELENGDIT